MPFTPVGGGIGNASDVAFNTPLNAQVLSYDSTLDKWQNRTVSTNTPPTKRTVTTNYTLIAADANSMILHSTASSAVTITLPQDSAATIAIESAIPWRAYGAGQVTFVAGTGATLLSRGSVFKSAGRYAEGLVTKVAANTWLLSGDIVA